MSRFLLLLLLLVSTGINAAVYKWVDSAGRVHFSDQPQAGAKEIELPEPTIYTPAGAPTKPASAPAAVQPRPKPVTSYKVFSIVYPNNKETIRANHGLVTIRFMSAPGLQPGHSIQLIVDGRIQDERLTVPEATLQLDRGSHMVHANIFDQGGKMLARSNIVQFFLQRVSAIEGSASQDPANSGASDTPGTDASQFTPDQSADFSGDSATPGVDSQDFQGSAAADPNNNPSFSPQGGAIPQTPGGTNPAFTPNFSN